MTHKNDYRQILQLISSENDFLIASHISPDGDAMGSTAALGHILKTLGKRFVMYNSNGLPAQFAFLPMPGLLYSDVSDLSPFIPKWHIFVDCGDMARVGHDLAKMAAQDKIINIDHHATNPGFGLLNWIEPSIPAVGQMIAVLAKDLGLALQGALATCLYLSIITDTGHFSYASTKASTLRLAAELVDGGVAIGDFNDDLENSWSWAKYGLWLDILANTKTYLDGQVSALRITKEALDNNGACLQDSDGMINFAMHPSSVKAAFSLRQVNSGRVKFSLRSKKKLDIQSIAAQFGGGGHINAAAGFFDGSLDEAEKSLVLALEQALKNYSG